MENDSELLTRPVEITKPGKRWRNLYEYGMRAPWADGRFGGPGPVLHTNIYSSREFAEEGARVYLKTWRDWAYLYHVTYLGPVEDET